MVPFGGEDLRGPTHKQGVGRDDRIRIPAVEQLKGLPDVLAIDDFRLNGYPEVLVLQGLLGGDAVGRELGVGQRAKTNCRSS